MKTIKNSTSRSTSNTPIKTKQYQLNSTSFADRLAAQIVNTQNENTTFRGVK